MGAYSSRIVSSEENCGSFNFFNAAENASIPPSKASSNDSSGAVRSCNLALEPAWFFMILSLNV